MPAWCRAFVNGTVDLSSEKVNSWMSLDIFWEQLAQPRLLLEVLPIALLTSMPSTRFILEYLLDIKLLLCTWSTGLEECTGESKLYCCAVNRMPLPEDFLFFWDTQRYGLSCLFETPSAVGCFDLFGISSTVDSPSSMEYLALWTLWSVCEVSI